MGQVGLEWQVSGFGEFSGNTNVTDMVIRNGNTGQLEVYDISGNTMSRMKYQPAKAAASSSGRMLLHDA